mmetsp:Transcript_7465/g.23489  ORF Transcript_7465/g.23489 Transcript_7465/m.23489 type:complete len:332 (+) Transcript_7465:289-1284(+)
MRVHHGRAKEDGEDAAERARDALGHGLHILEDAAHRDAAKHLQQDDLHALGCEALEKGGGTAQNLGAEDGEVGQGVDAAGGVEDDVLQVDVHGRLPLHHELVEDAARGRHEGQQQHGQHADGQAGLQHLPQLVRRAAHQDAENGDPAGGAQSLAEERHPDEGAPDQSRLPYDAEGRQRHIVDGVEGQDVVKSVEDPGHHEQRHVPRPRPAHGLGERDPGLAVHAALHGRHEEEAQGDDELAELHDEHRDGRVEGVGSFTCRHLERDVDGDMEDHVEEAAGVLQSQACCPLDQTVVPQVQQEDRQANPQDDGRFDEPNSEAAARPADLPSYP